MEIQHTEICDITTRAVLADDGTVRVSLHGSMTYGPDQRTVGMTVEVTDDEDIQAVTDALARLREKHADACLRETRSAQREAESVATRRGEYTAHADEDRPRRQRSSEANA